MGPLNSSAARIAGAATAVQRIKNTAGIVRMVILLEYGNIVIER
jgi:hypothetical protein